MLTELALIRDKYYEQKDDTYIDQIYDGCLSALAKRHPLQHRIIVMRLQGMSHVDIGLEVFPKSVNPKNASEQAAHRGYTFLRECKQQKLRKNEA